MIAAIKKITNQEFLQGLNSIYNEAFDFNLDSEDEEDEVFTRDFCFIEKCQSTVVNELGNVEPIAELTDDQWAHMKEQADFMIFLLHEEEQNHHINNTPGSAMVKNSHNIIESPQVTSSPSMNTRSKQKMQLTSVSPYKVSPLQDITNRSLIKPSLQIQKLDSSKLDTSTDFALYGQLGLMNPMKLNFDDDDEHSPKKSRCLSPHFTSQDSPLITDEAWDFLVSSPNVQQNKTVRESFGLNARMCLDAVLIKSRLRTKTFKLDEGNSILPSLLCPSILSSNEKEKTSRKNIKERSNKACEPELKPLRKSILNVSFNIDKDSETLLRTATPPARSLENVVPPRGTEKPTLNESFTINKSQDCLNEKLALNESFTINKCHIYECSEGKPVLNESFTINKSIVRASLSGKATLNESFTISDFSTMNEKTPVNESSTINKSVKQELNKKPVLNESFTIDKSRLSESVNEQPSLNESFTINNSQFLKPPSGKPVLNDSFTINTSQHEEIITEKPMNESFTVEGSQTAEVLTKKTVLNESFTLEKSILNVSFKVVDVSVKDSRLSKCSLQIEKTTSKKKSPREKQNSLNFSLLNKAMTGDKSFEGLKTPLHSRKRTLGSVTKIPTQQRAEPPSKTTVVSRSQLNKQLMPTIKSSIVLKLSTPLQTSQTKFTLKKPNLDFNVSSTLQKDNHGMVKFEEKSVVPTKKPRSSLLMPNKVTRKSLKPSPRKPIPKKVESKVEPEILQPKRKCLISTPPIHKIGSVKPAESSLNGNRDAPRTRLALPSKLLSNLLKADTGKQMSRIASKGPLKAFPTLSKVGEMKQSEGSKLPLYGKSKLKMFSPVKSGIPQIKFKTT